MLLENLRKIQIVIFKKNFTDSDFHYFLVNKLSGCFRRNNGKSDS